MPAKRQQCSDGAPIKKFNGGLEMKSKLLLLPLVVAAAGLFGFEGASYAAKPEGKAAHENKPAHQEKADHQNGQQKKKAHHQNGKQLLGDKIKTNGHHVIAQKGDITASVEVKNGKIAGLQAKHAKKGDLPVKKYKTSQKMAAADPLPGAPGFVAVQDQYIGTMYIGYSYFNDYGEEDIYWFPYDMILDGDTGAVEYVPSEI
jgi:hypothetical protein